MATLEQAWNRQNAALERIADGLEDLSVPGVTEEIAASVFGDGPFPAEVRWGPKKVTLEEKLQRTYQEAGAVGRQELAHAARVLGILDVITQGGPHGGEEEA